MVTGQVRVDTASIRRVAMQMQGVSEVPVVFRPAPRPGVRGLPPEALVVAGEALDYANGVVPPETVVGCNLQWSPKGVQFEIRWPAEEAIWQWLEAFAAHLEQAGWSGTVKRAAKEWPPRWYDDLRDRRLMAFVGYTMVPGIPLHYRGWPKDGWGIDPAVTARISRDAVAWANTEPDTTVYFAEDVSCFRMGNPDVTPLFTTALSRSGSARVFYLRKEPLLIREAQVYRGGEGLYQVEDATRSWQEDVEDLVRILTRAPDLTDVGFIHRIVTPATGWMSLGYVTTSPDHMEPADYFNDRYLWPDYVLDACGVQVLTESHLAKTSDLSDWTVQELTPGRYLVQARDLHPWYAEPQPDPDVLDRARRDFGGALLLREDLPAVLAAHEHLWTR